MENISSSALPPVALRVFETLPVCCVVLSPELIILTASDDHVKLTGKTRTEITGRYFFDVFPEVPEWAQGKDGGIAESLQQVLATRQQHHVPLTRFDVPDLEHPGQLKESYWQTLHKPVLDESGNILYIIHETRDVSNQVLTEHKLAKRLENERKARAGADHLSKQMEMLFHTIPAQIAIVSGSDMVFTYVNPQYQNELFPGRDVLGLPLLAALPEIAGEPIWHVLNKVYTTGEPFVDTEIHVPLADQTGGELSDHYFNVVYQPLRDESGNVNAILSFKYEVTEHVAARKLLEANEHKLHELHEEVQQAYQELQASNEELISGNEELAVTIESLRQTQEQLEDLNQNLEGKVEERTTALQESESEQQALNEELTAMNEELRATNEELADSQSKLEETVQQLAASEQKVRSLVESAPFPIGVYTGREMRIELLNQSIIDTWNRGSDLIGKTYAEVLPELAGTGVYERLDHVYLTGIPYHTENERVDLLVDGKLQPFYFNYDFTPLFDQHGKVYGVMNTASDVTELVNAKLQVEQSQKSLYNIIMHSPVSKSILLGSDYKVEIANDRMIALWGKPREAILNRPLFEGVPEAKGQGLEELLQDIYTTGNTLEAKERPISLLRNGQMETLYLDFVYQPYKDAHDNIIGVIVTAIDVTAQVVTREEVQQLNEELAATNEELKLANEEQAAVNEELAALNDALKVSQDELQLAIDAADLATWDLNPATGRFSGNDLTKTWFGLQPEDEIELDQALAAIADTDREKVIQAINHAMTYASGGDYDIHYTIINPQDQLPRVVRAKGKALFDEQQQATRLSGMLLDVTEQKKDEQRKNDFIGIVSHELKTPLTSLKALLQVAGLKLKASDDNFLRGAVEKSSVQVKKMEAMISGFLNISRLESGKMSIQKTSFDLQELIGNVIKETGLTMNSHRIEFVAAGPLSIHADHDKIESVVSNLLSNAIKYSPKGTTVTVVYKTVAHSVQVSVQDEGMGIKKEDQEKLFERYYRVETSNTKHISGFGIGLYLCAEIIERHGGKIWVDSVEGNGATFTFSLPLE
ncbi:PAS domain-containing protein [Mucilaginibacter sp. Bleaf8]|uniref:PAS domain-containing protein n=1 Tax=Mucilaginibacter sp. Bleaf8 TaxID=2834430 RepID=UPI001BCC9898|nr:PAS domain-containing protein [Mucilaginibacter sp. Bleaf8]MBS7566715.1 PAS domain-containing protein [Mucilaginibacter sp. Bleaf8]